MHVVFFAPLRSNETPLIQGVIFFFFVRRHLRCFRRRGEKNALRLVQDVTNNAS